MILITIQDREQKLFKLTADDQIIINKFLIHLVLNSYHYNTVAIEKINGSVHKTIHIPRKKTTAFELLKELVYQRKLFEMEA